MPKIPINEKPYQNVDESNLSTASAELLNGYINEVGKTIKREGHTSHITEGTSRIDGMFEWKNKTQVMFVSGTKLYKITSSTGECSEIAGDSLQPNSVPTWATNGNYLAVANGAKIHYTDNSTLTAVADADAPTTVSHIDFIDQYIVAAESGSGRFWWAIFTGAPTSWSALDFATAESNPDNLVALKVLNNEIVLIGSRTTEFWRSDGVGPFSRINGKIYTTGIIAKHSLVKTDDALYWMDDDRRIVKTSGSKPKVISTPFDRKFQSLASVSDCIAVRKYISGKEFLDFQFISSDKCYRYDVAGNYWSELTLWNKNLGTHSSFIGMSYAYSSDWNQHLIGSRQSGNIYLADADVTTDGVNKIYFSKRSGYDDQGTAQRKVCPRVILRVRRGIGLSNDDVTEPRILIRYRDSGSKVWSNERSFSLGLKGDTEYLIESTGWGAFRSRQWEVYCTAETSVEIIDMDAEIEALE